MANTALPLITGTATERQMLSVSDGTWTNSPTSFTRQWLRCDAAGANAVLIPSATGATYVLVPADVGKTIRCALSAFNSYGASPAVQTAQTAVIAAYVPAVPVNVSPPIITGSTTQGQTLSVSNGSWTNLPTSYTRQWQRCDSAGANAVSISGATSATYLLVALDVGKTIRCLVTAINTEGSSIAKQSAQTALVVAAPAPPPTGLATPSNFRVTGFTSTSISVAWNASSGATGYKLAISPASAPTSTTYVTLGSVLAYTFTGLSPSTGYQVDVMAFSATLSSSWAGRISSTTAAGAAPPPPPPPSTSGVRFALGSMADTLVSATTGQSLGVKLMRTADLDPQLTVAQVKTILNNYQSRGIEPLVLVNGNLMNTDIEAELPGLVADWADQLGPGGAQAHATLAPRLFEIGNEQFYNYSPKPGTSYAGRYAVEFKNLSTLVAAANPNVKCLAMLDMSAEGATGYNALVNGLYAAVSNFHTYVGGWVFHCYGPMTSGGVTKITDILNLAAAKGAPSTIGIYITEDGLASDNGVALTNNYGWPVNLTYAQAGTILRQKFFDMRAQSVWGSRVRVWTNYQARDQQASGVNNQRESYFGVTKVDGSAKGDMTQSVRDATLAYP